MSDLLTLFGFVSVSFMVLFYALESRSAWFVFAFGCTCVSSAIYAALIGSWPFAAVETIWSVVAFTRWYRAWTSKGSPESPPRG
ncbi:hypothetical protein Pan216_24530 [Planctomycetes bacterium Pan216]|uniref:Uncharacterized protein n=1 Tax=Kolteria novifilia TaxID=2527975 RepID=A0A518B3T1_9BACT|nr:hypothetical protein Pan216_24530 [Planctomycetes bacterium Pan216]